MFGLLLAAASLVALPVVAGEPTAADRKEAKRLYAEARKLRGEGKLDEAVDRFRRAHDLAPTPVTRLDLARGLAEQSKLVEARALALSIPAMPVTATETEKSKQARKEAEQLAKELGERIPSVTFIVPAEAGQEVAIDGKPVSKELLSAAMAFDPGDHVGVVRVGEKTAETPFKLAERETKSLTLAAPAPDEPVKAPPKDEPSKVDPKPAPKPKPNARVDEWLRQKDRPLTPAVPVLLSVGGVSLLAGAISGGVALSQAGDLKLACINNECPPSQADAFNAHAATADASTALFVIGGVVATAGAVVWIVDASTRPAAPPKVALRWAGTGLAMEGTWP